MKQVSLFDLKGLEHHKPKISHEWNWKLADLNKIPKNGLKVFSCFACGGGSTMGYKLAGCEVLGCVEIDKRMNDVYIKNHSPKYNYLMDIREFNLTPNDCLPVELFNLDILDGSPPCTTFSTAGQREKTWGVAKKFREGQNEQTLDDLSFVFIDTVRKLKPKVVIMENVEGLLMGNAWAYVQKIYKEFSQVGYKLKHWLLKGEKMGVPQTRKRVFFVAIRNGIDFNLNDLDMSFNYAPITYGEIKSGVEIITKGRILADLAAQSKSGEKNIADVRVRLGLSYGSFGHRLLDLNNVFPTILGSHRDIWLRNGNRPSKQDYIAASTFPIDYDFCGVDYEYICGMSVPPIMTKRVVEKLLEKREEIFS